MKAKFMTLLTPQRFAMLRHKTRAQVPSATIGSAYRRMFGFRSQGVISQCGDGIRAKRIGISRDARKGSGGEIRP
ncbi:hypothetical protein AX14_002446 [Amanita brunnescens Koide BX004]|nr:hypothetical protein AX14_002446 [Amanita brunnescens Koide BX004]